MFVSKIDPKEKARLTADAFEAAKKDATELATAAGGTLGKLTTIHRTIESNPMMDEYQANRWMAYGMHMGMGMGNPFGGMPGRGGKGVEEAVSPTPGKVTYGIQVNAQFDVAFPER
jgi:hypothetical protein